MTTSPAKPPRYLTEEQRLTTASLLALGFVIDNPLAADSRRSVIRVRKGNDYRLIQLNGTQKRAYGARQ